MGQIISSVDSRLALRNAQAAFAKAKIQVAPNTLAQSYLQFEQPINANQTSYTFPVTTVQTNGTTGVPTQTEVRLNQQDSFFVSHIGYFIKCTVNAGAYTGFQDMLFTFPSTALLGTVDLDRANLFWNGYLKLTVNQTVITPYWDLQRHHQAPISQRPIQSSNIYPWMFSDEFDGSQQGFYPLEPNWLLVGSRNIQLEGFFPRPFDSTIVLGGTLSMVIICRGVLAQNSTPVR